METIDSGEDAIEENHLKKSGIIYGDVGTSVIKCNVIGPLEQGEYLQIYHEDIGWVLGRAETIERKTDLSLEKAYEMTGGKNVDIQEMTSATINILGYRDDRGLLQIPRTPFQAGNIVYKATDTLIKDIIGLEDIKNIGAYIGKLYGHNINVYMDINKLVQKHVSILAKTGGGKSYLTGVLIEELMKHDVTSIIIDPHGEYSSLMQSSKKTKSHGEFGITPTGYGSKIRVFSPDTNINKNAKPLNFTLSNMSPRELLSLTKSSSRTYIMPLRKAMDMLKTAKNDFTISDIMRALESEEDTTLINSLLNELEYLNEVGIFARRGTKLSEIVQKGMTSIINLKGTPPDIQEVVVQRLSYAIFELRKRDKIPPLILVVEEAHNYVPQQGQASSSKILRTIASEGRKFGLGLCIISQRPAKIDKNILSQCNTQIILKVTNPNDLRAIGNSVEGLTSSTLDEIPRLPIGVALVMGGSISMPLFVKVRPRETKHGGESVKIIGE